MGSAAEKTHIRELSICRGGERLVLTRRGNRGKEKAPTAGGRHWVSGGFTAKEKKLQHKIISLEEGDSCTGDEYHGRDSSKIKLCQPPSSPPPPSLPIVSARPEEPGGSEVVPGVRYRKRVVLTADPTSQVPSADTHQHSPACAPVLTLPPARLLVDCFQDAAAFIRHALVCRRSFPGKNFRFMCVIKGSGRTDASCL